MRRAVRARHLEHFVAKYVLVERRVLVRIARHDRTPDPLPGRRQYVLRIAAGGLQHREHGPLWIGEYRLAAAVGVQPRWREQLAAVRQDAVLGLGHIAHREEGQPRRLALLTAAQRV